MDYELSAFKPLLLRTTLTLRAIFRFLTACIRKLERVLSAPSTVSDLFLNSAKMNCLTSLLGFLTITLVQVSSAIQVPLGPLKGRNCTEHAASLKEDGATKLSWTPKCDPDGTYAPVQFNHKIGLKFCVSKEGIMLVSPQRSLDFFADCNCPRRRFEKFQSGNFEGYIHRCDTDFTYAVLQYNPETKSTSCMMKNDVIIKEYSGPHVTACKCPRQWYEAKISRLPNRYGPQCNPNGTFKAKQCDKGRCWCANGEGEQISKRVPESDVESLTCPEV